MCYLILHVLNNAPSAFHVLVGANLLQTLSNSATCSVIFGVVIAVICFLLTLPRTLKQFSHLGLFSAVTMGIAVLLGIVFAGVQKHPSGYIAGEEPIVTVFPVSGMSYVMGGSTQAVLPLRRLPRSFAGMSAFLNITYVFIGQATIPSVCFLLYVVHLKFTLLSVYCRNGESKRLLQG